MVQSTMVTEQIKAVVTGGAGFIGAHLAHELVGRGFDTVVVDSLIAGNRERVPEGATFHQVDIRDTDALSELFSGARYVFHLAALPRVQVSIEQPYQTHEVNVTGTLSVLQAAREAGVAKVVFASSSAIYGQRDEALLREDLDHRPQSPYALHKLIGELYCRLFSSIYGLSTVSLRYFNVYGPGADPHGPYALVVTNFLHKRLQNKTLTVTGDGTQTRDFIHIRDVVQATLRAAESEQTGEGEVINVGTGKSSSVNRVAELIGGPVEYIAPRLEPHDTLADNRRARELLNWEPTVSLEQGIAELKQELGLA